MGQRIFIIAGEASGDMHGAKLVESLLELDPTTDIRCWGGPKMEAAGALLLKDYKELAFMGFWEVVKNLRTIFRNFDLVKRQILQFKPHKVVLIDYPGFNMRLLPWLAQHSITTYYYIAPQAWAWKAKRSYQLAKYVRHLFVILPFELDFFSRYHIPTTFVGHPLLEQLPSTPSEPSKTPSIALLPGSRAQEIKTILPQMLEVVDKFQDYRFRIAGVSYLGRKFYESIIGDSQVEVIYDIPNEVIASSQLALVASGTATLQTALLGVPQIVCYRSSWINYQLARKLIKVPFISLVNLIAQRAIVPELIQDRLNIRSLEIEIKRLLSTPAREQMLEAYKQIKIQLGAQHASSTVAKAVISDNIS